MVELGRKTSFYVAGKENQSVILLITDFHNPVISSKLRSIHHCFAYLNFDL